MRTEKAIKENSKSSRWTEKTETEAIWSYLQTSEVYRKSAGLYTILFHWFSLQKPDLEQFIQQQKAIVHLSEKGKADGLALVDDRTAREWHENSLQTCFIDGQYDAVFDMARFLESYCHRSGVKRIYGFVCNHKPAIAALEKRGFGKPSSTEIVYEKRM